MQPFLAPCLVQLRQQVDADEPHRKKSDDGWIGDTAHQQRHSDHNPDGRGCVCALDLTHDPAHFDSYRFAEILRQNRDVRLSYVISKWRIFSGSLGPHPWEWRPYAGLDAHTGHVHISVLHAKDFADNAEPWSFVSYLPFGTPKVPPAGPAA